ncbi:MAG: tetratricopeptide repeat protein, partial [Muribaculaceae bacterium]|nr:tetratricopeptide repeat protein [Muribaculaceae bacterium]
DAIREIALYNQALCAYDAKPNLFDSTLALFENFIREYPHSRYTDDVNSRISELHLSSRNYSDALDYINRIKQPSHDILKQRQQILYMLGTEAFANNRISEAGKWFEQAANAGDYAPEYQVRSVYWLGECRYRNGSYTEALQCYRQVAASNIIVDDAMVALAQYNMGYCYFRTKKYSSAGSAFELFVQNKLATTPLLIDAYSRIGDCYFQARKYTAAEKYYARAADYKGSGSDYALLQQAVVTGVSKNYKQKVSLLKQLIKQYPRSEYNAEAYNELAQTYISLGDNAQSIATYNRLVELFPESVLTRNAMLQLGALYYNQREMNASISAYKKLIVQHPTSGEAKVAIEDLKSIYIELNQVDELSQFMQQQGIDYHRAELDSLTYMAAERKYMTAGDVSSLKNYTTQFPHGAYRATAYYYMGNVADVEQKYDEALEYYLNSLQVDPHGNFAEEALARTGDILYDMVQYQRAATQYTQLEQKAASPELRLNAAVGALRCYVRLQQHREAIDVA